LETFETLITIGMSAWIAVAVALFVGVVYMIGAARALKAAMSEVRGLLSVGLKRLEPTVRNVERVSEDANYVIGALRHDLDTVGQTVSHAAESADRMVEMLEERVADLNGLLEVVQEEAEETFYSTAAMLSGFRRGRKAVDAAGSLRRAIGGRREG